MRFGSARHKAFLDRMGQRGMCIEFQPHVRAEVRQRAHGRGKTHRFANTAGPVSGVA